MVFNAFDTYCSAVCVMVRWKRYHAPITYELTAHMEDHADYLIAKGMEPDEAAAHAVAAMGDPYEIGKELDKLHSPWYPRLTRVFTVLAALLFLVSLFIFLNIDLIDRRFAPFADPAELVREKFSGTVFCEGRATGGGVLGAYSFFDGAALLYEDTALVADDPGPHYYLTLVLPSNTPYFWLDSPDLSYMPRLLDNVNTYAHGWTPTIGIFRRFNRFQLEVSPPFQDSYTFELGEDGEVSYTISLKEVAAK